MKKLLSLVFGLAFLIFGTTAFAEITADTSPLLKDLGKAIHTAKDTTHTELLEGKIDYGKSYSATDLLCSDIDFSKMYRRYPLLYNETYKERLSGSGLLELVHDEPIETYFGYGLDDNQLYRLHFADSEEASVSNPDEYRKFSQCYAVSDGGHNYSLEDYAEVLADIGVSEVYDAYLATFYVYSRGNDYCYVAYFDTDRGEYVMNIAQDRTKISVHSEEELEYLTLYPIDEFLGKMDIVLYDVQGYNQEKSGTRTNEDGDDIKVEKPVANNRYEDNEEYTEEPEKVIDEEPKTDKEKPEGIEDNQEYPVKEPEDKPKADEKPETVEEPEGNPEKTGIDVILFGKYLAFPDQKPIIENDRVLVPFRVIFEALEAEVFWDGDTRTVTATKGGITITLTIGKNEIVKNGEAVEIDVPAQIINSRTLVPVRVISESFENTVSWDGENKVVEIK